jgi:hypothetical protein
VTVKLTEKPRKSPLPHPARRHLVLAPSSSRFAAPPTARFVPATAVGSFVPTVTKKAFEKFGFSAATLITDWARIAGAELAGYTVPDKIKWPRGGEAAGMDDEESERRGATLILRVDPARALDVEYRTRQIMDRINSYFGYRAVETIRLVQAPLDVKPAASPAASRGPASPSALPDDPLLAALARMEQGVLRGRTTRRD